MSKKASPSKNDTSTPTKQQLEKCSEAFSTQIQVKKNKIIKLAVKIKSLKAELKNLEKSMGELETYRLNDEKYLRFVKILLLWDHPSGKFKTWKRVWINEEDDEENEEGDSREEFITEFLDIGMVTKKVNGVVGELKPDTKMDAIFGLADNSVTLLMEKYECKDRAYHFIYHFLLFCEKYMVRNPIGNGGDIAVKRKEMTGEYTSLLQSSVTSPAHAKGTTKFLLNLLDDCVPSLFRLHGYALYDEDEDDEKA